MTVTDIDVIRRQLPAGEARCAVFTRTYSAPLKEVWDACTNPERLARWYAPVQGDLFVGGDFTQGDFGPGHILECNAPNMFRIALGGGSPHTDEITLELVALTDSTTQLRFEHATTLDSHEIGGQMFDAVYCMGGGYGPRLQTLDELLAGNLGKSVDATQLHTMAEYGEAIQSSMATLEGLIEKDKAAH